MRSKNSVPVQVILPQSQMSSNHHHSVKRGSFEEALQSSIEASLRTSGTAPTLRVFSSLYHRSKPHPNDAGPGPSSSMADSSLLPPPDNDEGEIDIKPNVSDLHCEMSWQNRNTEEQHTLERMPSARSTASPREQLGEKSFTLSAAHGPPPLLVPQAFLRPSVTTTSSDLAALNDNRHLLQRLPSMVPKNIPIEQLKQAQEQVKQLQQIQRWHLLQHRQQQARAAGANSLSMPRIPQFNPLMPSALNRNALVNRGSAMNGAHPLLQQDNSTGGNNQQPSPGSPLFRKGFCKGGKDIRLSTLNRDGTQIVRYPNDYTLIAMSISPSSPQTTRSQGGYHPPDIPLEAMVVTAIGIKCLPPNQHELSQPLMAKCIGCGESLLNTFATLSSHINLRTASPAHTNISLSGVNPLQRHARNFIIRDTSMPHGCIRGPIIPWEANDVTPPRMTMSGMLPMLPSGAAPHRPVPGVPTQLPMSQMKYKHSQSDTRTSPQSFQPTRPHLLPPGGVSITHRESIVKAQPTTSVLSLNLLDNSPVNGLQKQQNLSAEWSPISSSGHSEHSPTSDTPVHPPHVDPDWNSTVKLPENLPNYVGRPLILVCWEWQQLQSNIQNVHITHSYVKCFDEALTECQHAPVLTPFSKEMCCFVTAQYLASLETHEFPTPSELSAWLGRARMTFAGMCQSQMTTRLTIALVRTIFSNCLHKMGLVISQVSQAHAINECIANLKPDGPDFHLVAHINRNVILDLSIVLTGHPSRLTREYLLTSDECAELIQQNSNSDSFAKIDKAISASDLNDRIDTLSVYISSHPNASTFQPSTSSSPVTSNKSHEGAPRVISTLSMTKDNHISTSNGINNDTRVSLNVDEHVAEEISEKLFTHVSSLSNNHSNLDLSLFSSIQFYFILPPSPVYKTEVAEDTFSSGVLQELGNCQTQKPSQVELRKVILTASLKSKQRFSMLCEQIKANSSTLYLVFCLDAHLHCDASSVGFEWMSTLVNEIMPHCRNLLFVSCTHIPQALLNQNTSIPFQNVLFPAAKTVNISHRDPCRMLQSTDVTFDLQHEAESVALMDSLLDTHSSVINANLLLREYAAALILHLTPREQNQSQNENLRKLASPITTSIIRDLLSSKTGITVLLRIPSEILATRFTSELIDTREKLKMQDAFEIMLFGSYSKPQLSEYFLRLLRTLKLKPDDWEPETFSELDCLPLLLIYTGKDVTSHLLPRNIHYVDLRLLGSNVETLTQSSLLSEISLLQPTTQKAFARTDSDHTDQSSEPPAKKVKCDSEDDAQHITDTFSDDSGSCKENKLQWRSFGEKEYDIQEFSSDEETGKMKAEIASRKRALPLENDLESRSKENEETRSVMPTVILTRNMHSYIESFIQATQKFRDLLPHSSCEWSSHVRTVINEKLTDATSAAYLRKWTRPVVGHPDYASAERDEIENGRSILLVTPPRNRAALACCLFTKKMNQILIKLLQVTVYDHKRSSIIKPCYPLPNVDLLPEYPVHTTILDMDYDTSVVNAMETNASQISNGLKDFESDFSSGDEVTTVACMVGQFSALDVSHKKCESCRSHPTSQMVTIHEMSVPNCGFNQQSVCDGSLSLDVSFIIPQSSRHQFVFQHSSDHQPPVLAINLRLRDDPGIKTPVFSLGISGARYGLFNLDHTLYTPGKPSSPDFHEIRSNAHCDFMHIIVVRNADSEDFQKLWPNHILMVLPESFGDLGIGAMKYAVQCVVQRSVTVREEQQNDFLESSTLGNVWPFALMLDDSCVMWTGCTTSDPVSSPNTDVAEESSSKTWRNISLLNLLERIESVPCVERYAAIGFRPWSSDMEVPKSEEDFSGDVVSSGFSKCHLTSCFAINASSTREEIFDFSKFLHGDIDWCTRIAAADLPLFRFNDIAVTKKVISSPSRNELISVEHENPEKLVSLADSDFKPILRHPTYLLEVFLARLGHTVFPKAKGNSRHPVLVVDHYVSLGSEVQVEFASSKPDALPWAMDTEKTYSGLLLYGQLSDMSQSFLQQFQFTSGATVCVVGRDRSFLRQTVVNLHLENDWHFRLTDEYQTTNDVGKRKPLFYLTGVARSTR